MKNLLLYLFALTSSITVGQNYFSGFVNIPTEHVDYFTMDSLTLVIGNEGEKVTAIPSNTEGKITKYNVYENDSLTSDSLVFEFENDRLHRIHNVGIDYSTTSEIFYSDGKAAYELFYEADSVVDSLVYYYDNAGHLTSTTDYNFIYDMEFYTFFEYDNGRLISFTTEDGLRGEFSYDEFGNMIEQNLFDENDNDSKLGTVTYHWTAHVVTNSKDVVMNINTKVYPNPVSDVLNIETERPTAFRVFNSTGRLVEQNLANGLLSIETSGWESGLYFIQFENGKTEKVVLK